WSQSEDDRMENRYLVNLAAELQPALENVPYLGHGPPAARSLGFFARRRERQRVAAHRRLWDATLRREPPRIWDQVVTREEMQRLYEEEPLAEALWCLATTELASQALDAPALLAAE